MQADAVIICATSGLAFEPLGITPTYNTNKVAMHSSRVSPRDALRGRVEVIELAARAIQTDFTPEQRTRERYLPLDAFACEAIALLSREPTPSEFLVERVDCLRCAEAENRSDDAPDELNGRSRQLDDRPTAPERSGRVSPSIGGGNAAHIPLCP